MVKPKRVVESEDVQFEELDSQADFDSADDEICQLLLYKTVELFVTVHSYSYDSNLMEKQ